MLHIKSAKHLSNFKIWVSFDDGTSGEVDLFNSLIGSVFESFEDVKIFAKAVVDLELETIVWPNGVDLAPEYVKDFHDQQMLAMKKFLGDNYG